MQPSKLSESEEHTRDFLIKLPLFDSFDVEELSILARHTSYIHLQRGEFLFVEGDRGTFMGFVVDGVLEVMKKSEIGENIVIARLTKGSSIGEMALIDKSSRSATVMAKQPTTMVTLTEKGFDILTKQSPVAWCKDNSKNCPAPQLEHASHIKQIGRSHAEPILIHLFSENTHVHPPHHSHMH